nr:MAG TPA: hypothetical protein [Caudoviricetes sp.]
MKLNGSISCLFSMFDRADNYLNGANSQVCYLSGSFTI